MVNNRGTVALMASASSSSQVYQWVVANLMVEENSVMD